MKIQLLFACFIISTTLWSQNSPETITWNRLSEAETLQKTNPKKGILIFFHSEWIGFSKRMEEQTLTNKELVNHLTENFYLVKINGHGNDSITYKSKNYYNPKHVANPSNQRELVNHEIANLMGVRGYPALVFIDNTEEIQDIIKGYRNPESLLEIVKLK